MARPTLLSDPPRLPLVAPSILAADFADLGAECRASIDAGADLLHLDVMDGHFVPNLTLGPALCASLRRVLPDVFLDVHLMVTDPGNFVEPFAKAGADHITFHLESNHGIGRTGGNTGPGALAERIRERGMTAGLAINPPTDVERILPHLDAFDMILVMSVNPGYAGQAFIGHVLEKTRRVRDALRGDQRLQMDGGVSGQTAASCRAAGCDVLVAGSALFGAADYASEIAAVRGPSRVPSAGASRSI